SFEVAGGSMLVFSGNYYEITPHTFEPASEIRGFGNIRFGSAPINILGSLSVTGTVVVGGPSPGGSPLSVTLTGPCHLKSSTLQVADGLITFDTGQMIELSQLIVSGGTLAGNDAISVSGPTFWSGGMLAGAGTLNIYGGLTINGATLLLNRRSLNNFGLANWMAGSLVTGGGSVMRNATGATFDIC